MTEGKHTPGPYDVFVGNANGRGLIRIETANNSPEPGIVIATAARGKQREIDAMLLAASWDLLLAAQGLIAAQDDLRQFERENPNDTTKQWANRLYAVGTAEEALRAVVTKVTGAT